MVVRSAALKTRTFLINPDTVDRLEDNQSIDVVERKGRRGWLMLRLAAAHQAEGFGFHSLLLISLAEMTSNRNLALSKFTTLLRSQWHRILQSASQQNLPNLQSDISTCNVTVSQVASKQREGVVSV
jgi:hypothetical protein